MGFSQQNSILQISVDLRNDSGSVFPLVANATRAMLRLEPNWLGVSNVSGAEEWLFQVRQHLLSSQHSCRQESRC